MTLEEARIHALSTKKAAELAAKRTGYTGLNIPEVRLENPYDLEEIQKLGFYAEDYGVPKYLEDALSDLACAMAQYQDMLDDANPIEHSL